MGSNPLKVIIIGAGTGGLCLAHGLKSVGITVEVFEREHTPSDRQAGYRLSISPTGNRALKECLSESLFQRLVYSSARPTQGVSFLDERLKPLLLVDLPKAHPESVDCERPISRVALRHILLEGLDELVRFNKKFVAFEDAPDGRVTARFEDGTAATGDLLIGADGASSPVRAQLLPHAPRVETGIMAVSGKVGLNDQVRELAPSAIFRGPTLMLGPKGCFLFASAVEYNGTHRSIQCARVGSNTHDLSSADREEYVMWGFSARREKFGSCANLDACDCGALKTAVLSLMKDWDPAVRWIVQNTADISTFLVKTSVPIPAWKTRNVTLLGDALHNMTPFRGMGANVALRDAAALRSALARVVRGELPLLDSLAAYERQMIEYGFRAVRTSLGNMRLVHSQGIAREFSKLVFRLIDSVPALKERFHSDR